MGDVDRFCVQHRRDFGDVSRPVAQVSDDAQPFGRRQCIQLRGTPIGLDRILHRTPPISISPATLSLAVYRRNSGKSRPSALAAIVKNRLPRELAA